jgi:hypothetical protein
MNKRWVKIHIMICAKLGLVSIYELLPILSSFRDLLESDGKRLDSLYDYMDTFGALQHLLNKKICKELNIDPVDVRNNKGNKKKRAKDPAYQ